MRVFITGGNGFVGSHIIDALREEGAEIITLSKRHETFRSPLEGVNYIQGGFGEPEPVKAALSMDPDILIHVAHYGFSLESKGLPSFDVANLVDSVSLFERCIEQGVKKIIFMSSGGKVYGRTVALPIDEKQREHPIGSYGITKLAIEKHLESLAYVSGIDAVIIRPSNPYGLRQNPLGTQGVVPIFLWKMLHEQPIFVRGDGESVRDYIDVRSVAAFCVAACQKRCAGIYNLGSGNGVSLNALLQTLANVSGIMPKIVYQLEGAFDMPAVILDSTRAREEMSWRPNTDLRAGLQEVFAWLRELAMQEDAWNIR